MEKVDSEFLKEMHEVAYSILDDVDGYCKKNNIVYYLSGGSCLGAVRHKGFIPWDHDVDLMMPRKDYNQFLVGFDKVYSHKYKVGSLLTEKKWIRPYSKVWDINTFLEEKRFDEMKRGISIDIFPIDGLPQSVYCRKIYYKITEILTYLRIQMIRIEPFDNKERCIFIKKILRKFGSRKGSRFFSQLLNTLAEFYDYEKSNYVGVSMACHYWEKETIEKKYFDHAIFMPFEGKLFPIVNGYDTYLSNLYGNYMIIPEGAEKYQEDIISDWNVKLQKS